MPPATQNGQPAHGPPESVEEAIVRIGAMNIGELRSVWRETFGSQPPPAFSKELLARAIAYRLQEEAYGGLKASTARLLRSLTKPGLEPPRRVKVGSVIVREHEGVLYEVMVVPRGFLWQGQTFDSLSTIAKKITGVSWNGPRFFGLRSRKDLLADVDQARAVNAPPGSKERRSPGGAKSGRAGRRSSIRTGARP